LFLERPKSARRKEKRKANDMKKQPKIDVEVRRAANIFQFVLKTKKAHNWVDENVHSEPWQWMGNVLNVEHDVALNLSNGMQKAGLKVV